MSEDLPKGWASVELEDHVYIAGRIGWRGLKRSEYTKTSPLFLAVKNILPSGELDFRETDYISQERYDESPEIKLQTGDILLTKDGSIGKVGMISSLPGATTVNSSILVVRPQNGLLISRYLFHFLRGPQFQSIAHERITGSAVPHLFQKDIKKLRALVPPLGEQLRIVEKLEKVLGKVDACQQRLAKIPVILKRFRQSVLAAAYSGRLTADWRARNSPPAETGHAFLQRIKKEKQLRVTTGRRGFNYGSEPFLPERVNLPKLPNTWAWSSLAEIGEIVTGKTPSKKNPHYWNGKIPFVMPEDLAKAEECLSLKEIICTNNLVTEEGFNSVQHLVSPAVFVCCIGTLGRVGIIRGRAAFSQQLNAIIPQSDMCLEYVAFYCHTIEPILKELWPRNTYMPIVNKTLFSSVPIPVPPVAEQEILVKELRKRLSEQRTMEISGEKAHAQIARLNQSILAKAFRGELVPQDPNDEPAYVLLERIKAERAKREVEVTGKQKENKK